MNADPSVNVVVFEIALAGRLEKLVGDGPTRADDCVQRVWKALAVQHGAYPSDVRRIYSEWDPSPEDKAFIDATFPAELKVTYSFSRPAPDGWDQAMREVAATIESAAKRRADPPPQKSWWQFWK
jgi:hypothetical protein